MRLNPLALLIAAIAVVGAVSMALAPITAAVAADLGVASEAVVTAGGAFGLATMLSALFLAPRGDAIGADRALIQAIGIQIVGLALSAVAPGVLPFAAAQAITGVGSGMALPAIYGLAPQVVAKGQESRAVGKVLSGWVIALTAGVAGAGFVAEYFGWRTVYAIFLVLDISVLIALRRLRLDVSRGQPTSPLTALRVPGIWPALTGAFLMMFAFYGTYAFLGAHVGDVLGRGADGAGFVTLAYGTGFGLSLLLDPWLDAMPRRRAGVLSLSALALSYGAMALSGAGFAALLAIGVIWGITQHAALSFAVSRLANLDARQRGAVMGLNSAQTYLGVMLGAVTFQFPYAIGGFAACAAVSAALAAAAALEASRINGGAG